MEMIAEQPNSIFLGQAVNCPGTAMYNTLKDIDESKRLELPVAEALQMGMSTGLALNGFLPVSIYPRWNFLLLATDQLVNHLDKIELMSDGGYKPKVIIRTSIGSERPLHPSYQHVGDFTDAFNKILSTINVVRLDEPEQIVPAYQEAIEGYRSTILVEWGDYYNDK